MEELALPAGARVAAGQGQPLLRLEVHSPSCRQLKGRTVLEDSFSPCLPPSLRQVRALQGCGSGHMGGGHMEGLPLLLFCSELGPVKGQSAQKSESQQVVATPHPQCQTNKQNREMKKMWGGGQTKTEPPDLLPMVEGPASSRRWGPRPGGSSWAGTEPGPRSCPHHRRPQHPHCSGL